MVGFGIAGLLVRKRGVPPGPLVLAPIPRPMLEKDVQQSSISCGGSRDIVVEQPICATLPAAAALPALPPAPKRWRGNRTTTAEVGRTASLPGFTTAQIPRNRLFLPTRWTRGRVDGGL